MLTTKERPETSGATPSGPVCYLPHPDSGRLHVTCQIVKFAAAPILNV
jgi:hypothetical protein